MRLFPRACAAAARRRRSDGVSPEIVGEVREAGGGGVGGMDFLRGMGVSMREERRNRQAPGPARQDACSRFTVRQRGAFLPQGGSMVPGNGLKHPVCRAAWRAAWAILARLVP